MRIWGTLLAFVLLLAFAPSKKGEPSYPKSWPKPVYDFRANPVTEAGFTLGKLLFYDPILSRDSTISCGFCHSQFVGFTHSDHAVSHGIENRIGVRNAPVLINLAWNPLFMHDGGVNHLDLFPLAPMENAAELDQPIGQTIARLSSSELYRAQFKLAFGDTAITTESLLKALSQFTACLISKNSKYDQVKAGKAHFTPQEESGYKLFLERCNSCHTEPLFTNHEFAAVGLPINPLYNDLGRVKITGNPSDSLKFKVPTLRNIEFSGPYMHDGRIQTISAVIKHYGNQTFTSATDPRILHHSKMNSAERTDLLAFLLTLSDAEFLFNDRWSEASLKEILNRPKGFK